MVPMFPGGKSRLSATSFGTNIEQVDISVLWSVYSSDLDPLEAAIDAMLAAHSADESSP